jgi:hypothetical protein
LIPVLAPLSNHDRENCLIKVGTEGMNEDAGQTLKPVFTFGVYLEQVFLPLCRRKWKESTRMTTEPRMTFHLKPSFGAQVLLNITRDQMQTFLDQKPRSSRAVSLNTFGGTSMASSKQP